MPQSSKRAERRLAIPDYMQRVPRAEQFGARDFADTCLIARDLPPATSRFQFLPPCRRISNAQAWVLAVLVRETTEPVFIEDTESVIEDHGRKMGSVRWSGIPASGHRLRRTRRSRSDITAVVGLRPDPQLLDHLSGVSRPRPRPKKTC
jgi:hypothetical protein